MSAFSNYVTALLTADQDQQLCCEQDVQPQIAAVGVLLSLLDYLLWPVMLNIYIQVINFKFYTSDAKVWETFLNEIQGPLVFFFTL